MNGMCGIKIVALIRLEIMSYTSVTNSKLVK